MFLKERSKIFQDISMVQFFLNWDFCISGTIFCMIFIYIIYPWIKRQSRSCMRKVVSVVDSYPRLDGHIKCKNYLWITQYIAVHSSLQGYIAFGQFNLQSIENGHAKNEAIKKMFQFCIAVFFSILTKISCFKKYVHNHFRNRKYFINESLHFKIKTF